MHKYSLKHLSSEELDSGLDGLLLAERPHNARVLAYVAEIGARGDFRRAGYPTMYAFLMGRWHLSESAAHKRSRSARVARQFPMLFEAVADGRLHMSGIAVLADHLTADNVEELIVAATHQTRRQIEQLVAERFPHPDLPCRLRPLPTPGMAAVVAQVVSEALPCPPQAANSVAPESQVVANKEAQLSPETVEAPTAIVRASVPEMRPTLVAIAPQRFALQLTISAAARNYLQRAQELLGHRVAPNDIARVLELALEEFVEKLEKTRCARTDRPRKVASRASRNPRHVPAAIKRQVRERDGEQCTFVSESGVRCQERKGLEVDHIVPVARGGRTTADNLRLLCRPHNQYTAECSLGAEFMRQKRADAISSREKGP